MVALSAAPRLHAKRHEAADVVPLGGALTLVSLTALVFALPLVAQSHSLMQATAAGFWSVVYLLSLAVICIRLGKAFYAPDVVLLLAYLLILGVGSVLFPLVRGAQYWSYSTNLIGIGYLALWAGCVFPAIGLRRATGRPLLVTYDRLRSFRLLLGIAAGSMLAALALFASSGVPLLAEDINEAKLDLFSGKGYLGVFFRGLPVLSLAFCYYVHTRRARGDRAWSHALAVAVAALTLLTGFRAMTLIFAASYVSLASFLAGWRPGRALLVGGICAALAFLAAVGTYRRDDLSMAGMARELAVVTTARPAITDNVLRHYDEGNFYYGLRYFGDLVKLLPGTQAGSNVDLKFELFANAASMPEMAGLTPGICAESFMNFGAWWVPVSLFLVGLVARRSYDRMRRSKSVAATLFYFTLVFSLAGAMQSGIGTKVVHLVYIWLWILIVVVTYRWKLALDSRAA